MMRVNTSCWASRRYEVSHGQATQDKILSLLLKVIQGYVNTRSPNVICFFTCKTHVFFMTKNTLNLTLTILIWATFQM